MSAPNPIQPCGQSHQDCRNKDAIEALLERARQSGLRRTRALRDVVHILAEAGRPLTLADVAASRRLESRADPATVYRLLTKLEQKGLLRRLGLHQRAASYVMAFPGSHQDYLICTRCGSIEPLDIRCPVESLESLIAEQSGYSGLYHELEFFGLCPRCQAIQHPAS
ncbi:MAG: transcriptional repressor [Verrucomicrobiales bacterium]|nr:transcriptional repressor [Verrucomicrobiales bacterium]